MNKDVIAISESYKTKINPYFILQENFTNLYKRNAILELQEWYHYDVECLNELLINEGLGDALKSVGQKIGGAVKGVGNFALKKLATALGKVLKMAMPSEEEAQKLASEVEKLKTDPNYLKQQATAGNRLLGGGENEASEEFYESNKEFLLYTVFSESNLRDLFNSILLTEAKVGRPKKSAKPAKASKSAAKPAKPSKNIPVSAGGYEKNSVKALDTHINDLVKIISGMRAGQKKMAFNRIARSLGKQTKLEFPLPYPRQQKGAAQTGTQQTSTQQTGTEDETDDTQGGNQLATQGGNQLATQGGNQLATQGGNQLATQGGQNPQFDLETGQTQSRQGRDKFNKDDAIDAEFTDVSDKALPAPQQQPSTGLFKRIIGYIKSHPRITSSIAIALIAAATAASGGALLPLVITGLSTGGVQAGVTAYGTKKQGGKVDWSKTVDSLFTGAAKGVGLSAIGQGVKGLMNNFDTPTPEVDKHDGGLGPKDAAEVEADGKHDGGLGAKDAAEAQADAETNAAQYPKQVTDAQFKQYNATPYNPKSPLDQAKKQIMQKLSSLNSGQIPDDQYNDLAKKAKQLISQGKKPENVVAQLFPESYTVNYLRYF
jgi:hypothetical protein